MNPTPPHDPTPAPESIIVIRLPREEKGRFVAASRAAGQPLATWIRATLTQASEPGPEKAPPGHPGHPGGHPLGSA